MDLKMLLENFEVIAEAENGIQQLRDLVLRLAFQGLIISHNSDNKSVGKFLEELEKFKKSLIASGNLPKKHKNTPLSDEELPFSIPDHWVWRRMSDIFDVRDGTHDSPQYVSQGIPLITSKNLSSGQLEFQTAKCIEYEDHIQISKRSKVEKGDILFAMIGSIGNPVLVNTDKEFSIKNVALFKPYDRSKYDLNFLLRYLIYISENMRNNSLGGVQKFVSLKFLRQYPFPLPPLEEQQRIVEKIDELMELCDRAEARKENRNELQQQLRRSAIHALETAETEEEFKKSWHFVRDNFSAIVTQANEVKNLRQLVLDLAIRGKLTEESVNDKPALELLSAIQTLKKQFFGGKIPKNNKVLKPIETEEIPFNIPPKWKWERLGNITICRDGERIPLSKNDRDKRQGNYDYYGASGVIDKLDDYLFDKPLLLIGEDGANLINRSTPIAFIASGKYWVNNHAHVLDSISYDVLKYLEIFINAIDLKPYITGTAQPKMNQAKMNSILVAVPPIEEQKRIVSKVDELMKCCDRVEENLSKKEELASAISASIIHHLEL